MQRRVEESALSNGPYSIDINGITVHLLPEKAVFIPGMSSLLVADVHLGKAETFQALGVPIPNQTNHDTLYRLLVLCQQFMPEHLFILGDLFHAPLAMTDEVIRAWVAFVNAIPADVHLIVGNHDRPLVHDLDNVLIHVYLNQVDIGGVCLSHEPMAWVADLNGANKSQADGVSAMQLNTMRLNICGHIHPCIRLKSRLDDLRLPCFYLETQAKRLTLPSFGAFTGGYEVAVSSRNPAYAIANNRVIPFESHSCP